MSEPKIARKKLADYKQAAHNPNQHTERGLQAIEDSINYNGAGRSGLATKDGVLLAGNGTYEAMARAGIEDVIEIEIDGRQWVVVKRSDLDEDDARAKALMIADNRAQTLDYREDSAVVAALLADIAQQDAALVRAAGYNDGELRALLKDVEYAHSADEINIPEQYMILIECETEKDQTQLLSRFETEGIRCRALIS